MKILILTALPQEYSPLKKLFPSWRPTQKRPFRKFAFSLHEKEIILIESGMGARSAKETLETELAGWRPDLLIFSGFAGGLHPDLPVGAVCFIKSAREISSEVKFHFLFPAELADFLAQNLITPVLALSADTPQNKRTLSILASGQPAVLDMETASAVKTAMHYKIPFICFRAVGDAINDDLGFDLNDICDDRGRIRLTGVLITVARKPAVLKAFYLSWRRSSRAAKNLCASLAAFLWIPAPVLSKMAAGIRIERA
jgi:adenosylhomocysteine nucleosidase